MVDRAIVVGTGPIARRHLANLRARWPEAELHVVRREVSRTPIELLQPLADRVHDDLAAALEVRPDIGIVANAATAHADAALQLLDHGVPVLVEKPLATDLAAATAVAERAEETGLVVEVGYDLRFHPAVQAIHAALRAGAVGAPLTARAEVGQHLAQWRPGVDPASTVSARRALGGGALLELSHEIDYLQWLLGRVVEVSATTSPSRLAGLDVEDVVDLQLRHADGTWSTAHLDMVDHWPTRRCRVVGEEATIGWDTETGSVVLVDEHGARDLRYRAVSGDGDAAYGAELVDFVERATRREPSGGLRDAVHVVAVVEAARISNQDGRRVAP